MTLTQITEKGIKDGEIVNADINASAAIAKSKLASLDIVNGDINASAAIAKSKLASLDIVNGDINASAAIAGTKISPNFGSQSMTTTGNIKTSTDVHGSGGVIAAGASDDLSLWHDGTNSYIRNTANAGELRIRSHQTTIRNADDNETQALFHENGAVELYYDNSKKFETTNSGVDISGALLVTNGISIPDTKSLKLGDSDDLQIYHDPDNSILDNQTGHLITYIPASKGFRVQKQGGQEDILNAYADGTVSLYYDGSKKFETSSTGVDVSGQLKISVGGTLKMFSLGSGDGFNFQDNVKAEFGNSGDLQIYHDGSNSYLDNSTGNLYVRSGGNAISIRAKDDEQSILCQANGSVELYYDNSKCLETVNDGGVKGQGNFIVATAGRGLQFNASDSGSSEILDDYEEGEHTFTTNSNLGAHSSYNKADYTKIGNMVTVTFLLYVSSVTSNDWVSVSLPYANRNESYPRMCSTIGSVMWKNVNTGDAGVVPYLPNGASLLEFYKVSDNASWDRLSNSDLSATDQMYVTITYKTAT